MAAKKEGSEQARRKLPALLERAHRGQTTVITKHGVPYAAIVPVAEVAKKATGVSLQQLRGTGKGLWGKNAARFINKLRAEWK